MGDLCRYSPKSLLKSAHMPNKRFLWVDKSGILSLQKHSFSTHRRSNKALWVDKRADFNAKKVGFSAHGR